MHRGAFITSAPLAAHQQDHWCHGQRHDEEEPEGVDIRHHRRLPSNLSIHACHTFRHIEVKSRRRNGKGRSEEHTSELQSLMRISYAVFCLKKKNTTKIRSSYNIISEDSH